VTGIPTELIKRARAVPLEEVVAARGIVLRGRGLDRSGPCPRPGCGGTDRFSIHLGKQVFNCRGCGASGRGAIDLVMFLDDVLLREAVESLVGDRLPLQRRSEPIVRPVVAAVRADDGATSRRALGIWGAAEPLGELARQYLAARGVALSELPDDMSRVLRWHDRCPWENETQGCLVALWTDTLSCVPRAIHRRPISPEGKKLAPWRALGPTAGCSIRLWSDSAVELGLVLGEGVETVLSAATNILHRGTLLRPAWAAGDAGHIAAFPILNGVESLTILVDHDADGKGQRAAAECARRWASAGRWVFRLTPRREGADFADVVCS
jgi:hypothetical protein